MDMRTVTTVCNVCATGVVHARPGETIRIPRAEAEALVLGGAAVWADGDEDDRPPRARTLASTDAAWRGLDRIKGIGLSTAAKLAAAGCADVAALADLDDAGVAHVAGVISGVSRQDLLGWREQARRLEGGDE